MMGRMMVAMMSPLQSLPRVIARRRRRGSNSSRVNPTVAKWNPIALSAPDVTNGYL
jgi:hypothetical protein